MNFLTGKSHSYKFTLDDTKIFVICNARSPARIRNSIFYTIPYEKSSNGVAMYGTIYRDECVQICNDHNKNIQKHDWFQPYEMYIKDAKFTSSLMHIPLLVTLNSMCNIDDHEEVCEFFYSKPEELLHITKRSL
jgi:hypothetical protein